MLPIGFLRPTVHLTLPIAGVPALDVELVTYSNEPAADPTTVADQLYQLIVAQNLTHVVFRNIAATNIVDLQQTIWLLDTRLRLERPKLWEATGYEMQCTSDLVIPNITAWCKRVSGVFWVVDVTETDVIDGGILEQLFGELPYGGEQTFVRFGVRSTPSSRISSLLDYVVDPEHLILVADVGMRQSNHQRLLTSAEHETLRATRAAALEFGCSYQPLVVG